MIDHHVDRPDVEAQRCAKLTGPNRPTGSRSNHHPQHASVQWSVVSDQWSGESRHGWPFVRHETIARARAQQAHAARTGTLPSDLIRGLHPFQGLSRQRALWMGWTTWWLWRGARTRSHPELGRENPQRPWYCASRHGRVGRRQVLQPIPTTNTHTITPAGWSSPVARQAHNLKAAGSNPAPATISTRKRYPETPAELHPPMKDR